VGAVLFPSLRGYRRRWLSRDVVAGLTVWAVLVPEALAYATIAGVSPVVGLYAAPPALVLYALFGSSRHLVVGPMSATAALSAAAVADVATDGDVVALTAALAVVTGVIAAVAGLCRLGFVSNFISEPVLKGFIIGMALTIIVGQLPKLFGVERGEGDFFEQLGHLVANLGDTSLTTLAVGLVSLAVVLALRRFLPLVPGSLVAVALGVVAVALADLDDHGVAIVGPIDSGLPAFGLPDVSARDWGRLAGAAVGVMFIGFAEGLGAAKTYAAREHYDIDAPPVGGHPGHPATVAAVGPDGITPSGWAGPPHGGCPTTPHGVRCAVAPQPIVAAIGPRGRGARQGDGWLTFAGTTVPGPPRGRRRPAARPRSP
jgi:MFS superfamily sulfate permease-like transporter